MPLAETTPLQRKLFYFIPERKVIINNVLIAARVNGLAFMVYLGLHTNWYFPLLLWLFVFVMTTFIQVIMQKLFPLLLPAMLGLFIVPVFGIWIWFSI